MGVFVVFDMLHGLAVRFTRLGAQVTPENKDFADECAVLSGKEAMNCVC